MWSKRRSRGGSGERPEGAGAAARHTNLLAARATGVLVTVTGILELGPAFKELEDELIWLAAHGSERRQPAGGRSDVDGKCGQETRAVFQAVGSSSRRRSSNEELVPPATVTKQVRYGPS